MGTLFIQRHLGRGHVRQVSSELIGVASLKAAYYQTPKHGVTSGDQILLDALRFWPDLPLGPLSPGRAQDQHRV